MQLLRTDAAKVAVMNARGRDIMSADLTWRRRTAPRLRYLLSYSTVHLLTPRPCGVVRHATWPAYEIVELAQPRRRHYRKGRPMSANSLTRLMVAVALTIALVGCSVDDDPKETPDDPSAKPDAYCALLERVQGDVSSFDFRSLSQAQFTDLRDKIQQLADAADGQIQTDWQKLGGSLDQLQAVLDSAHLTVEDLPQLARGQVPNGADVNQIQAVSAVMQTLSTDPALASASADIQADARDQCDVNLGGSAAGATPSPADTPAS